MNITAETVPYPVNHTLHRRTIPVKHSSMYVSASPIAVSNKIRAIQTRKSRINLQTCYEHTDIRPLNIGQTSRMYNSSTSFNHISPEKLVERSKELRLGRLAARAVLGTSVLSNTSVANQQSFICPNNNSTITLGQDNGLNSPIGMKSSVVHMPEIAQRTHRTQASNIRTSPNEQQNAPVLPESRNKSIPKSKPPVPKTNDRTVTKAKSPNPVVAPIFHNDYFKQMNNNPIQLCKSEEDVENPLEIDEEFEEYVQKAMVKCADWLIKYVFDQPYYPIEE